MDSVFFIPGLLLLSCDSALSLSDLQELDIQLIGLENVVCQ